MFPGMFLCSMRPSNHGTKKKKSNEESLETEPKDIDYWYSVHFNGVPPKFALRSETNHLGCSRTGEFYKEKKRGGMPTKVSNFSGLIQRVTASCLLRPLAAGRQVLAGNHRGGYETQREDDEGVFRYGVALEGDEKTVRVKSKSRGNGSATAVGLEAAKEMETVMEELSEAASSMKRAYVALQEAHSQWDPQKLQDADVAVVTELGRIGVLRERLRGIMTAGGGRSKRGNGNSGGRGMLREAVAPYEALLEELIMEAKVKDSEIENLKEKLKIVSSVSKGSKKRRSISSRKVSCSTQFPLAPAPKLFEMTMSGVKEASKAFTSLLLSLMRAAHWDIAAAVRSIEAASAAEVAAGMNTAHMTFPIQSSVPIHHAKYALESYVCRRIFQGFDHETFYMDGSPSSLLNPEQYRRDCLAQFKDMRSMDPIELLGILPTCRFGKFCSKKYLTVVHPKMEESLFGDADQRLLVLAGNHPRTQFYGEFLALAKAVWLLHLLAFSLEPVPNHFEVSRGAEFHPQYMESVNKFSGGHVPVSQVVGFPISPGFKLSLGSIIRARVYLVPRT